MPINLGKSDTLQIIFEECDPKQFADNKTSFNEFRKLFKQFDKAEAAYYKKLHWHWHICTDKEIKEVLTEKTKRLFVGKQDDNVVAFATLWGSKMGEGSFNIAQICVDENLRGKKIGRKLLKFIFDKTGNDQLFLTVTATNEAGKHLYESMGFKVMSQFMWKER